MNSGPVHIAHDSRAFGVLSSTFGRAHIRTQIENEVNTYALEFGIADHVM